MSRVVVHCVCVCGPNVKPEMVGRVMTMNASAEMFPFHFNQRVKKINQIVSSEKKIGYLNIRRLRIQFIHSFICFVSMYNLTHSLTLFLSFFIVPFALLFSNNVYAIYRFRLNQSNFSARQFQSHSSHPFSLN